MVSDVSRMTGGVHIFQDTVSASLPKATGDIEQDTTAMTDCILDSANTAAARAERVQPSATGPHYELLLEAKRQRRSSNETQPMPQRRAHTRRFSELDKTIKDSSEALKFQKLQQSIKARIAGLRNQRTKGKPGTPPPPLPAILYKGDGTLVVPEEREKVIIAHLRKMDAMVQPTPEDITAYVAASMRYLIRTSAMMTGRFGAPITMDELLNALLETKSGKAAGGDSVPPDLLKWLPPDALQRLVDIYNKCLSRGVLPTAWLEGHITLLLKPGRDAAELPAYRPITLLSTMWKVLERILLTRMVNTIKPQIEDEQGWGFKGRGAAEQSFVLTEAVAQADTPCYAAFLDLREAFDRVWTERMLVELHEYGVDGAAWRILQTWYQDYKARVILDRRAGLLTESFRIETGTRQGSVLSPVFFAVAMNGLIRRLKQEGWERGGTGLGIKVGGYKLPVIVQADDIVLLAPTTEELQVLLNITNDFVVRWRMDFSITKCKVMALRQPNPSPHPELFLRGHRISWCETYKHLGIPLAHGDDLFQELVLQRCAAALAEAREVASLSASQTRTPLADRALLYLTTIATRRDYGLHALRLSEANLVKLQRNEEAILMELRIARTVPTQRRFKVRHQERRRALLNKLARAPPDSWRRYLVQRLPDGWT